jgi:hypothetical protein
MVPSPQTIGGRRQALSSHPGSRSASDNRESSRDSAPRSCGRVAQTINPFGYGRPAMTGATLGV